MTMFIFIHFLIATNQICLTKQEELLSIIRGNYKNALQQQGGAIMLQRLENAIYGSPFNDAIYKLSLYAWNKAGQSITFQPLQLYELNTLKIWFWEEDSKITKFKIYIINEKQETLVYDSTAKDIFILRFPDQFVKGFRILNDTVDNKMKILKAEAFYNSKADDEKLI